MSESWLPVVGFEGLYEVSNLGQVRGLDRLIGHPRGGQRLWRGRQLKQTVMSNGYFEVSLCSAGARIVRTVHSVVAEAFHGPGPAGYEVAHANGRRLDNRADNLSWKTRADNHADKIVHGTTNRGMRHGNAKLSDDSVRRIRRLCARGWSHQDAAAIFGVSRANVSRIIRGEMWVHV